MYQGESIEVGYTFECVANVKWLSEPGWGSNQMFVSTTSTAKMTKAFLIFRTSGFIQDIKPQAQNAQVHRSKLDVKKLIRERARCQNGLSEPG